MPNGMKEHCRACLKTENVIVPMDDSLVNNYNLITSLNIMLLDNMPQNICRTCKDAVTFCITFRNRCISSEATLQYIKIQNENRKEPFDIEAVLKKNDIIVKTEIKSEVQEELIADNIPGPKHFVSDDCINGTTVNELQNFSIEDFNDQDEELKQELKAETQYNLEEEGSDMYVDTQLIKSESLEENVKALRSHGIRSYKKKRKQDKNTKTTFVGPLSCGLCSEVFDIESNLNNHLQYHILDRYCEICQSTFLNWPQLLGHRTEHLPPHEKYCHICKKRYKSYVYLENHYMIKHYDGEKTKPYCYKCNNYYDTPKKLDKHMWHMHSGKKFICHECSQEYRTKSMLTKHLKIHLETKAYMCDLCGYSCNFSTALKSHNISKHSAVKIYCKRCRRVFGSQKDHDKHKCGATEKQCPICGKTIGVGSRLSRHMKSHNEECEFKCDKCPAQFKVKTSLINHKNFHDGNKNKACEFCPAKFYYGSALIKHRRIHTGERPYVCKICGKGFTGGNNLKIHMKVHGEDLVVKKIKPLGDSPSESLHKKNHHEAK